MWCNQIFSLIADGTIQNIIVCDNYETANQIARTQYGESAFAEDTTQYPVSAGCKYIKKRFYEPDGKTLIRRNPTTDEEAKLAMQKAEALQNIVDTLILSSLEE